MYTEEERAKWRERFARWRNGEQVYDAGKIVEKSDNTSVQRQEPVQPIKRNFIAEAQRKHAAEAVSSDTRSSYQRKQSQSAKQYINQQYQKAKDDVKREEGFSNLMKMTSPSTYAEAITGKDFGTIGGLTFDIFAFGLSGLLRNAGKKALQQVGKSTARDLLQNPNDFRMLPVNMYNPRRALPFKEELPPEATYTGKIPTRVVDYEKIRSLQNAKKTLNDIANDPNEYTMEEIHRAYQDFNDASSFSGTIPIVQNSSGNTIEHGGQTFREHLKHNINPVLRHDGFKGVPLDASPDQAMQYVRNKYRELNTFVRGIIDPRVFQQYDLYNKVEYALSNKLGRPVTHDEIMDYMAITPNRGSTGHGAAGRQHGEYTLYTSNGMDQAVGYALRGDNPLRVNPDSRAVYELELPEYIRDPKYADSRFSPIGNYILNNRFALESRRRGVVRDLYSEYGLPYQLGVGKSLSSAVPATVDYNESLRRFADMHGIPVFGKDVKGSFVRQARIQNADADFINEMLKAANSDITVPYISYKTSYTDPKSLLKARRIINYLKPLANEYNRQLGMWPEEYYDKLNQLFLSDVKRQLKQAKKENKLMINNKLAEFTKVIKHPEEKELKAAVEKMLGKTPPLGYLKHPNAHNVFTSEGFNSPLRVNDKRYYRQTYTGDPNATLQHYVFFGNTNKPILNIKRRVPFDEWFHLDNHGSSHFGSYTPGLSRRMR